MIDFTPGTANPRNLRLAARMCSIIASTPRFAIDYGWHHIDGINQEIANIAFAAHDAAPGDWMTSYRWAEAEALLRTGWTP